MRIIVCAKHVVDSTEIRFDEASGRLVLANLPTKISDYDRNALEAAVKIKESREDVTVDVVMVGGSEVQKTLKEALAMGADTGYLVEGGWESPFDPVRSAGVLARAIEEIGVPDLILVGVVSEDGYNGLTGAALAEFLGMTYLAPAVRVDMPDGQIEAVVEAGDVRRTYRAAFPAVVAVDSSANVPRLPTVLQTMKVKADRIRSRTLDDLGLASDGSAREASITLVSTSSSAVKRKGLTLVGGADEAAAALVEALEREGVLA